MEVILQVTWTANKGQRGEHDAGIMHKQLKCCQVPQVGTTVWVDAWARSRKEEGIEPIGVTVTNIHYYEWSDTWILLGSDDLGNWSDLDEMHSDLMANGWVMSDFDADEC